MEKVMKFSTLTLAVLMLTGCSLTPEQAQYIADGLNDTTRRMNQATFRNSQTYQQPVTPQPTANSYGSANQQWKRMTLQSEYPNKGQFVWRTCNYRTYDGAVARIQVKEVSCYYSIEYNLNTNAWRKVGF